MIRVMWLSRLSNICWSPINGQSQKICRLLTNSQVLLKGMDTNFRIVVCKLISLQDKIFILLLETRVSRSQDMCPGLSLSGNSPVSTSKHCVYRQPTYCIILGRKQKTWCLSLWFQAFPYQYKYTRSCIRASHFSVSCSPLRFPHIQK